MIEEPVPTMPESVPAIRPTDSTNRKSKVLSPRRSASIAALIARRPCAEQSGVFASYWTTLFRSQGPLRSAGAAWLTGASTGIENPDDPASSPLEFEAYFLPSHLLMNRVCDDERPKIFRARR